MSSLPFRRLFTTLFVLFIGFFAAAALQAWTGPTATAPNGNVSAPVNVGTSNQVKNAGLSVNALTVFGSQYIQSKLGIGRTSPVVALDVNGTLRLANGGETCQAVTEGSQRYNATTKGMEYCDGTSWKSFFTASQPQVSTYTSSGTWTKPASGSMVFIECWGGGGGGAGGYGGIGMTGGGGGGYVSKTMTLASLPATVAVTVGGGGAGGPYSYTSVGGNGGSSSFGSYAIGYGGYGGGTSSRGGVGFSPQDTANKTAGGSGLGGSYSGGTGEKGGDGGAPDGYDSAGNLVTYPPGAGACAGGGGGNGPAAAGGTSGCSGNGGTGGGNAGAAPGGGGGGGATYGAGGSGAAGKCVVTVS